jgi:hypothetical protein
LIAIPAAAAAGIDTLLDDMAAAVPEWSKLLIVPGLLEPWNDVRDKWQVATDEFKVRECAWLLRNKPAATVQTSFSQF